MKYLKHSLLILSIMLFCSWSGNKIKKDLPIFNVNKFYPKKEIILQDIADVEYIPLETKENVLIDSWTNRAVSYTSDKNIAVYHPKQGDIFIFDNKGKLKYKFNHRGQSGREYNELSTIIVDDFNMELFIIDIYHRKRIQVYSFDGRYKRTLNIKEEIPSSHFYDFNEKELIFYKNPYVKVGLIKEKQQILNNSNTKVIFINKENGNCSFSINLSVTDNVNSNVTLNLKNNLINISKRPADFFIPSPTGVILNEIACDTTYVLTKNKILKPIFIRTPKISVKENPLKMLGINAITKDNIFFTIMQKKYEIGKKNNCPTAKYTWNRKDNGFYEYTLKNTEVKQTETLVSLKEFSLIEVDDIKELLEQGKLKGKLKILAEKIKDDDNPILMRVKLKNNY